MEEKNELNDIILNKGSDSNGGKKVLLAVATLAIILIIVVVIMNRINSDGNSNLPQAVLPPEPSQITESIQDDPLFEPVDVIEEQKEPAGDNLDKIAQKLKEESMNEQNMPSEAEMEAPAVETVVTEVVPPAVVEQKPAAVSKPAAVKPAAAKPQETKSIAKGKYYVQVGSFARYKPNQKFLKSITDTGYSYTFHKVARGDRTINKVLVGPFNSEREARAALPKIRKNVEAGAFVTKV